MLERSESKSNLPLSNTVWLSEGWTLIMTSLSTSALSPLSSTRSPLSSTKSPTILLTLFQMSSEYDHSGKPVVFWGEQNVLKSQQDTWLRDNLYPNLFNSKKIRKYIYITRIKLKSGHYLQKNGFTQQTKYIEYFLNF